MGNACALGHREPVVVAEVDLAQPASDPGGERARELSRGVRVLADAETEVQPIGLVPERAKEIPRRERILPARDRDEHPLSGGEHVVLVDRFANLLAAMVQEAIAAERRVVAADVDHGRLAAPPAFHRAPPETTGRISTTSVA